MNSNNEMRAAAALAADGLATASITIDRGAHCQPAVRLSFPRLTGLLLLSASQLSVFDFVVLITYFGVLVVLFSKVHFS